ncbi:MAG: hypothetical protein NVSMB38_38850 [Ktedonobacteraceae bacterium]
MIQANSTLVVLRRTRLLLLLLVTAGVIIPLWYFYNTSIQLSLLSSNLPYSLSPMASLLLTLAGGAGALVITILQGSYWQRIEQRRLTATLGDRTLLAAEQPQPNAASLRLPASITLRYRKESLLLWPTALVLLGMLLGAFLSFMSEFVHQPSFFHRLTPAGWVLFLFIPIAMLITIAVFVVVFSQLLGQQLGITEDGLTSRSMGQTSSVCWNEARLFARYETFGAQNSGAAITYELSSATDIVRWTWVRRRTYLVGLEPTLSLAQYVRQEEALLSLVAAKTGLALYDMSGHS